MSRSRPAVGQLTISPRLQVWGACMPPILPPQQPTKLPLSQNRSVHKAERAYRAWNRPQPECTSAVPVSCSPIAQPHAAAQVTRSPPAMGRERSAGPKEASSSKHKRRERESGEGHKSKRRREDSDSHKSSRHRDENTRPSLKDREDSEASKERERERERQREAEKVRPAIQAACLLGYRAYPPLADHLLPGLQAARRQAAEKDAEEEGRREKRRQKQK